MEKTNNSLEGMFNLDPETMALRAKVLNTAATKRWLKDTAAKIEGAWKPSPTDSIVRKVRSNRLAEVYDIQTREVLPPKDQDPALYQGDHKPGDDEPILTFLNLKDLEHCETWETMSAILGLKGVPHHRLTKPDGTPADVRIDEREDGLMIEVLPHGT